jgi:uncharacterized protein with HEPN domain
MPFDQYLADARTRLAVERCRSILAEAARKLGTEAESRCPEVPWIDTVRLIPGCGEYPIITHRVVSNIITHDLAASRWHVSGS